MAKNKEEIRKAKIVLGLQKKKFCESRALDILTQLLEPKVSQEYFIKVAKHLNPSYYNDCTEERSLAGLCGYPICSTNLPKIKIKQQYKISIKENKVYDITERKRYCSDICYKSSIYVEKQLWTSPLWLRNDEDEFSLSFLNSNCSGLKGEEVRFTAKIDEDLEELVKHEIKTEEEKNLPDVSELLQNMNLNCQQKKNKEKPKTKKSKESLPSDLPKILNILKEWYTIDSLKFIKGDSYLRARLQESGYDDNLTESVVGGQDLDPELRENYLTLLRKLNEQKEDSDFLPLTEESLKASAFLSGKTSYDTLDGNLTIRENPMNEVQATPVVLPHTDKHSQKAMRKKIVSDQLSKISDDLLKLCHIRKSDVYSDLKSLISTFNFTSDNIVLQQRSWTLMALLLFYLISEKNEMVIISLNMSEKVMNMLFMTYGTNVSAVKNALSDLPSDLDRLVRNMTKN